MKTVWFSRLLCIAATAMVATAALADPPARAGRIAHAEGNVSVFQDPDEGWRKAAVNVPVTGENSIWIDGGGRAEIRIGASAIRVADETVLDFVQLQDDRITTFLQRGTINLRIRQYDRQDFVDLIQVDTGNGRFLFDASGRYRLQTNPATNESRVAVFSGRARFDSGDTRLTVDTGRELLVRSGAGALDLRFEPAQETPFDRWAEMRDQQWDQAHTRYARESIVSPYMTGYEDLDYYGDWIVDAEYGRIWAPRAVVSGWAPYRYGHWSYVRPWGWTWIDDAAWGFAPFHYGRWVQVRSRWCWWPGSYVARPVYAPALVGWLGLPGIGITISSGPSVGWFPLAPHEHYLPRYSNNANYIRRINNVTGNIVVTPPHRFVNQVPGSTVVHNNVFTHSRPVGSNIAHLPPRLIAGQPPNTSFDVAPHYRRPGNTPGTPGTRPNAGRPPGNLPPIMPSTPPSVRPHEKQAPIPGSRGPLPAERATPAPMPMPATPYAGNPAAEPKPLPRARQGTAPSAAGPFPSPLPNQLPQAMPSAPVAMPPATIREPRAQTHSTDRAPAAAMPAPPARSAPAGIEPSQRRQAAPESPRPPQQRFPQEPVDARPRVQTHPAPQPAPQIAPHIAPQPAPHPVPAPPREGRAKPADAGIEARGKPAEKP